MSTPVTTSSLTLESVELVSTLHTAPQNGAPSSRDYYDGELEKVTDLSTLAGFVNDVLLPMLSTLAPSAAAGIEGTSIYTDSTGTDALVFNSQTGDPLTVTDSMRVLYARIQAMQTSLAGLGRQLAALQAKLSASNQNDIALALQSITALLAQDAAQLTALANGLSAVQILVGTMMDGRVESPLVNPGATESVAITWTLPFPDNSYVVSYGVEDDSGYLLATGFSYLPNGTGIAVRVFNTDNAAGHQGFVHAQARASQMASSS